MNIIAGDCISLDHFISGQHHKQPIFVINLILSTHEIFNVAAIFIAFFFIRTIG